MPSVAERHFRAIWHRAKNEGTLETLTPELIVAWAAERGLQGLSAEERDVGVFGRTKSIVLTTSVGKACFPKMPTSGDDAWRLRQQRAERNAATWAKMEWFAPFWVPPVKTGPMLAEAEHCSKERAVELFDYHTSTIYTLAFQAVCVAQVMSAAPCLKEFCPLAREAFLAFYSGYRASSISALIPAIEGSLSRIVGSAGHELPMPDKIDRIFDRIISDAARFYYDGMWVPPAYSQKEFLFGQDERVFGFETFRRWLLQSFFRKTGEYDGTTWLNRHVFAHGAGTSWQQAANFRRLVVALATIGLVEAWYEQSNAVSVFFVEMNDDSTLLWQQAQFQAQAQMTLKLIEQAHYQQHGRLVPEMPTDDGATLRKAILSEDCIKDLVRPLRDAGWKVDVGEPEENGLYMTVAATAEGERFGAALLFGCATDNAIYRMLAERCQAILYRGAPYHQDQYAYGIEAHVGPVAGWQPPRPRQAPPS